MIGLLAPEEYPRRLLVCAIGLWPQIVTETLYALAVQKRPRFVPTEVHVISTQEGCERVRLSLLSEDQRQLRRLVEDHELVLPLLNDSTIHVIRSADGHALDDIRTPADNAAAADCITQLIARLCLDEDAAVHVSIAGGRKTMSYYLGYALSLFGRAQDRMSHVLVSAPFENVTDFFYPTPRQRTLHTRDGAPVDAAKAVVDLAEIPFVRMRDDMMTLITRQHAGFSAAVAAAELMRRPAQVIVDTRAGIIICDGTTIELPEQLWLIYAFFAFRRKHREKGDAMLLRKSLRGKPRAVLASLIKELKAMNQSGWHYDPDGVDGWSIVKSDQFLSERLSRLTEALEAALGAATIAARYDVIGESVGRGREVGYLLAVQPQQIEFRN